MTDTPLKFNVYRARKTGVTHVGVLLGVTRHLEDAKAVLKNWHVGYIIQDGTIVHKKNME